MKATEAKLLEVIRKAPQFIIPIYQRTYSWTDRECRQLWDDVVRAGRDEKVPVHFLGSIVYVEDGLSNQTDRAPLLVIDGQQRLTTVMIFLAALRSALNDEDEPFDGFSRRKIENRYLRDPDEDGERSYKLLLTQTDKDTLKSLLANTALPHERSVAVERNFQLFRNLIGTGADLTDLCRGLSKLIVVEVALNREHDNPQLIFESMNSTGRQLSQADLIRNYVLMGIQPDQQTRLYHDYWRPMELSFGQEAYADHFDSFMRHFLTFRTGNIPRIGDVYEAFKDYASRSDVAESGTEALVSDLRRHARYYCNMVPNIATQSEPDKSLSEAFADLHELKVDTAFPFLLELYGDHEDGILPKADFLHIVRLIEAYVFRRVVCAIPTNTLNKTFAAFGRALRKDAYLESVAAHFLSMKTYRRFPTDEEFQRDIVTRDLYNMRQRSFWLRRFENFGRKERVPVEDYTIEHIMPQNENVPEVWRAELGAEWRRIHETWLHTLGNLTLTAYNSEYRDRAFAIKRDMENGFGSSPLRLNKGLGQVDVWNEDAIADRARRLADQATHIWASPQLSHSTLSKYQSVGVDVGSSGSFTEQGSEQTLFEVLRQELLALDEGIVEQVQLGRAVYNAESELVLIVPKPEGLLAQINVRYADVVDPKGLCVDAADESGWPAGGTKVLVGRPEEIPYLIGVVRQALEIQIGGLDEPS